MASDFEEETKEGIEQPLVTKGQDRAFLIVLAGKSVGEMFRLEKPVTVIGRSADADIQLAESGISRRHVELIQTSGKVRVRDLGSTNGTYCNGDRVSERPLNDGDKIQIGSTTILKFTLHDSLDESFHRQMYESALFDGLTKVFNKSYFLGRIEAEFAFAARHRTPLSLAMLDIDRFKEINDAYGHLVGDQMLAEVATVVGQAIRKEDVLARYGGEEFAVICRGIDQAGTRIVGERVRQRIAQHRFEHDRAPVLVTVSVGIATLDPDQLPRKLNSPIELVSLADGALYRAKREGRNRVVTAG